MYVKLKNDIEEGIGSIRWFASLLAERVRIELAVFRLTCQSEEFKKKRNALFKQIGEEVYRARNSDKGISSNRQIADAIRELESLEPKIKETDEKVSDITRIIT
jgi:seryl-tRNA synthetase